MPTSRLFPLVTGLLALAGLTPSAPAYAPRQEGQEAPMPTLGQAQQLMAAQQWQQAAVAFARITEAEPENAAAWFNLGYCLHMMGDLDRAHDVHLKAATFEGSQTASTALFNHACVHARRGEAQAAVAGLEEARAAGMPNLASRIAEDHDFDEVREDPRFQAFVLDLFPGRVGTTPVAHLADLPAERRFDFWLGDWSFELDGERFDVSVTRAFDGRGIRTEARKSDGTLSSTSTYVCRPSGGWVQVWLDREGNHALLEGGLQDGQLVMNRQLPGAAGPDGRVVFADIRSDSFESRWEVPGPDGAWTVANRARFTRR